MKIKQTASLKPPGCFRNVWIWAFLSCSRIFKENRPERLQVESKEPSVCVPPPGLRFGKGSFPLCSGLCPRQAEPVLRARPTAQVSVESRSELGTDQPHSLTNTFTPEAPQQSLGAPDCTASWQPKAQPCSPRGPLLPRKTKPSSFPWKITWLKGRELKRSPQKGDLGLVLRS